MSRTNDSPTGVPNPTPENSGNEDSAQRDMENTPDQPRSIRAGESTCSSEKHVIKESVSQRYEALQDNKEKKPTSKHEDDPEVGSRSTSERTKSSLGDSNASNIVDWDGDNDPDHPYNWPAWHTGLNCGLINVANFICPLGSTIFAPAVSQVASEFNNHSPEIAAFVVSVDVLGFAFGPLGMAPLSELYGRVKVLHVSGIGFLAFTIACAVAPNMTSLIIFRFLSGVFGSCIGPTGAGAIADMVPQEKRAVAVAVSAAGGLLGPIVGPILGGFVAAAWGWRWTQWVVAIPSGVLSILIFFGFRECYHPVLLERKAVKLRRETGDMSLKSKFDLGLSPSDHFKRSIIRPLKLLVRSPIVSLSAIFIGVSYAILFLMFTSMASVFREYYNFSTSVVGLAFIGLGVGSILGVAVYSVTSDRQLQKKVATSDATSDSGTSTATGTDSANASAKNEDIKPPEQRLFHLPIGSLCLPIGLLIYGWTVQYRVHWIVPIMATSLIAAGNILVYMSLQMFLVDSFTIYAASALAAMTVVRSVAAGLLPLSGLRLYDALGVGWGSSLLAFINLFFVPMALAIKRYGAYLRHRYEFKTL
ncbi:uncharacterized protein CTRU02_201731 [Colletotrichum truncatum]|uniref:Uncharacterized protein n=1 Tax=Colletotrichum truncatum TaxID=5467 RepID=A0ACC3ZI62_COLTU|nr:uncharacterized protein CTRU02_11615 [Colletotrichum truncatum]KAF6785630.1 hypothetical protein CTRU02_11615 [Colletotrichum truncatum]